MTTRNTTKTAKPTRPQQPIISATLVPLTTEEIAAANAEKSALLASLKSNRPAIDADDNTIGEVQRTPTAASPITTTTPITNTLDDALALVDKLDGLSQKATAELERIKREEASALRSSHAQLYDDLRAAAKRLRDMENVDLPWVDRFAKLDGEALRVLFRYVKTIGEGAKAMKVEDHDHVSFELVSRAARDLVVAIRGRYRAVEDALRDLDNLKPGDSVDHLKRTRGDATVTLREALDAITNIDGRLANVRRAAAKASQDLEPREVPLATKRADLQGRDVIEFAESLRSFRAAAPTSGYANYNPLYDVNPRGDK